MVVFELLRGQLRIFGFQIPAMIQGKVSLERLDDFLHDVRGFILTCRYLSCD